jgi:hypothetical protein
MFRKGKNWREGIIRREKYGREKKKIEKGEGGERD